MVNLDFRNLLLGMFDFDLEIYDSRWADAVCDRGPGW